MAAGEEKLKLVLSAVDKVTAPLRSINRRIEELVKPVRKVRNAFKDLAKEAHLDKLGAGLSKLAGWAKTAAVAAIGAGAGILAFAERTADAADSLSEFVRLVGMNVEEFQQLQWAAKRAGIDNDVFAASMKTLARNVGAAKAGTGKLAGLLKKVAPTTLKQIQATKSTGEALEVVLGAMRRLPDVTKRNILGAAAFGNSMMSLLATLSPEEVAKFRKEASALGMVMSTETATAAESLMDNVDALKGSIGGLAARIAESLFPDLQSVTDQLLVWIKANKDLIVSKGREWILKVAKAIEKLADGIIEAVPQVVDFVDRMGGLKGILVGLVAINLAPLIGSIVQLGLAMGVAGGPATAIVAALAGIFYYRKELADFFGLSATPSTPSTAPKAVSPVGPRPVIPDFKPKVDVSGTIGITVDGNGRPKVSRTRGNNANVEFGLLDRGRVLAPN